MSRVTRGAGALPQTEVRRIHARDHDLALEAYRDLRRGHGLKVSIRVAVREEVRRLVVGAPQPAGKAAGGGVATRHEDVDEGQHVGPLGGGRRLLPGEAGEEDDRQRGLAAQPLEEGAQRARLLQRLTARDRDPLDARAQARDARDKLIDGRAFTGIARVRGRIEAAGAAQRTTL